MSLLRLGTPGFDLQSQLSISQFVIPAGAGATYAVSNNIATFTSNAAHGLTMNPAAGVPPNYYVTFGGSTSGLTGNGILVGNVFRILTIPSTTTFTFYCTITAATVTSTTVIPVFFAPFTAQSTSSFAGGPTQTISATVTPFPPANLEGAYVHAQLAANCVVSMAPNITSGGQFNNSIILLDAYTTAACSGGNTPSTAPTLNTIAAASTNFNGFMLSGVLCNYMIQASGTTATSTISVVN
jgi:hypothetical protein